MKRIRVVLCVVLVMAMLLAMSAGPAAAGSKPNSVVEPSLTGSKSVGVQGIKNDYGGYGG